MTTASQAILQQSWTSMAIALCLDQCFGEPSARWHPVVWMGQYLQCAGRWLQTHVKKHNARDLPIFWRGALAWWTGALLVALPACALQWLLWQLPWGLAAFLTGILLKPLLSWRMLMHEVRAVDSQLTHSLEAGRHQLARIVSRDVHTLDAEQVRESALESLAENLNDSVIAPLVWFILLGLPGAAVYRYADTADSMWGYRGIYRGQYWEYAGKWAARADDVLAWLPARITALALLFPTSLRYAFRLPAQAAQTPSPNSGWPMASMALVLDIRLRKPGVYILNANGQSPQSEHIRQALQLATNTVLWAMVFCAMVFLGGVWLA